MKTVRTSRFSSALRIALAVVALASGKAAAGMQSQDLLDLMAQGKTETDLGHYDAAIRALDAIVEAPEAPAQFRLEALVRLGVARRANGDFEGALRAFERVANAPELGAASKALLVQALGEGLPGTKRWAEIWPRVSFTVERSRVKRPPCPSSGPMPQPAAAWRETRSPSV